MSIPRAMGEVAYVDTEQMIEVDRAMVEDFHIDLIQMMENAGRNLAALGRERFLDGDPIGKRIAIMAGSGGSPARPGQPFPSHRPSPRTTPCAD